MRKTLIIIAAFLIAGTTFAQKSVTDAQAILKRVTSKTSSYSTIKIGFEYLMKNPDAGINEKMSGTMYLKKNKYRIEMGENIIINDAVNNWVYNKTNKEVMITESDPEEEGISPSKILTSYSDDFTPKLIREEVLQGVAYYVIDLKPKTTQSYHRIRLLINKKKEQIHKASIYFKEDNSVFTYNVKSFTPNVSIGDSKFTFKESDYPNLQDVIDLR